MILSRPDAVCGPGCASGFCRAIVADVAPINQLTMLQLHRQFAGTGLLRLVCCLVLPGAVASQLRAQRTPLTGEQLARWQHDSAQYVRDSTKWVRDSAVRDSISRAANTDSLYHLYRRMLTAVDPIPIMALVNCETGRLTWEYGGPPALGAMSRMYDTL